MFIEYTCTVYFKCTEQHWFVSLHSLMCHYNTAAHYDIKASITFQIKDIQETDAGLYQCRLQISVNSLVSAEVELQVRRPPIISDNSTQSLVVSEGQSVQLECYASGFPLPRISWRRENNAILPTGGSIYRYKFQYVTFVFIFSCEGVKVLPVKTLL